MFLFLEREVKKQHNFLQQWGYEVQTDEKCFVQMLKMEWMKIQDVQFEIVVLDVS